MDYDPIASLESIGYAGREASFLYLVAMHSGYFLRRQYHLFARRQGGRLATRLLEKAVRHQHIQIMECGQGRHLYHLTSKPVYEALGLAGSQHRRIKGDAHIKSRLMVLDFILTNLHANLLENEAAKVDFFTTQCGVRCELLPQSYTGRLMYFSDGFPILVSHAGVPHFTFFDEGQVTATRFERFLQQYRPLFAALGQFELTYLADVESNCARAKRSFDRFLPSDRQRGVTILTPLGVEHFLEFLAARQRYEAQSNSIAARDLEVLREGEHLYVSLEHQALYAAWKIQSTSADKIRQRFLQTSMRVTFTTAVLPFSYPIYTLRQDAVPREENETQQQTPGQPHEVKA